MGIYSSVGFPSESILTLLPKYSGNFSGDSVWMGIIVTGLSALANSFNCLIPCKSTGVDVEGRNYIFLIQLVLIFL